MFQSCKVRGNLVAQINLVELQVCARFEQVGNTFGFLYAGKLEQNLTVLALQLLNIGSHNAELVDTGAENVKGGVYLSVDLFLQRLGHLGV